jgi:phospholipid/cholesterol/gamma-HCH transport system permease protein
VSGVLAPSGIGRLGEVLLDALAAFGDFARLVGETLRALLYPRPPLRETLRQLEAIGVRSTTIVVLTALFTGMVLSLQTAFALARFGARPYVGSVVGLALLRELGPVLAAIMVGGRVGSGITAELGSMRVTEQVDAIRAMGADPVQKLVLPRVVAATAVMPFLAVLADVIGIAGGMVIANVQYQISPHFFLQTVTTTATLQDFLSGVAKTPVFGALVAWIGCFLGLRTRGGTVGVGRATTRAVVVASIAILIADFLLTKALLAL